MRKRRITLLLSAALTLGPQAYAQGNSGNAPGQNGSTPGQSGSTPGQSGGTPAQGGSAPGQSGSTPGQSGSTPGQSGSTPGQSGANSAQNGAKLHGQISWLTEKSDIEKALLDTGKAKVEFKSSGELKEVEVWLAPSLKGMKAKPENFALVEKDKTYAINLELEEKPTRTLGGTLHLRDGGATKRSYAQPLPIIAKVKGSSTGDDDDSSSDDSAKASVAGVAASTNYRGGRVSPGQTVSIFGQGIGPNTPATGKLDDKGRVATVASNVQVLFNGLPAPILMAVKDQINVVAPHGLAADKIADIIVAFESRVSQTISVPVDETAAALFSADGSGKGQAAALNQNGSVNGASRRARRGEVVTLFGSGFGAWKEEVPDGVVIGTTLPTPRAQVEVKIDGVPAKVLYAGGAPGTVAGVVQINVEVPQSVRSGERVEVEVSAGGVSGGAAVTIAID